MCLTGEVVKRDANTINATLYKNLPFDAIRDFAPVSLMVDLPMGIFVHPSVPAKTLPEFIALAKSKPKGLTYAVVEKTREKAPHRAAWWGATA